MTEPQQTSVFGTSPSEQPSSTQEQGAISKEQGTFSKPLLAVSIMLVIVMAAVIGYQLGLARINNEGSTWLPGAPNSDGVVACTMDAKICPDGSTVGRSGPNCEFDPCLGESSQVPEGWQAYFDPSCNVTLPVPPREEPYIVPENPNGESNFDEGGYWQVNSSPLQAEAGQYFSHSAHVIFSNPEGLGGGYAPGYINVSCADNVEQMTLETTVESYSNFIEDSVQIDEDFYVVDEGREVLWGNRVARLSYRGGMADPQDKVYLLTTPQRIYLVSKIVHSSTPMVRKTSEQIFSGLLFHDLVEAGQ
jgi:hypothetical protein